MQKRNGKYTAQKVDDPRRAIQVEVGDSKQAEFHPQVKSLHWDNECNFSARLVSDISAARVEVKNSNQIEYSKGQLIARFYEKHTKDIGAEDGGFEFEIELLSKPASNTINFTIEHKGLVFYPQAALTPAEVLEGVVRPDNIVGSYAVYHATKAHNTQSKHYRSGKAFHIYRPWAEDATKKRVWCSLIIAPAANLMAITIPQDFIDSATYPIIVDPTLGYTSWGASNVVRANNQIIAYRLDLVPLTDGLVDSISLGLILSIPLACSTIPSTTYNGL